MMKIKLCDVSSCVVMIGLLWVAWGKVERDVAGAFRMVHSRQVDVAELKTALYA